MGNRAERRLAAIALVLFVCLVARHRFLASEDGAAPSVEFVHIAGRKVAIWKPLGPPPADGYPVILFSHGFTGCGVQSVFLTHHLAEAGYFVLAPDHHDAACGEAGSNLNPMERLANAVPDKPFRQPEAWSDATYRDRGDDIESVLDAVLKAKSYASVPIDPNRVGLAGHSLGGYTVLALAGAWPSWKDKRVKAVLALSPYCAPLITKGDLAHLGVPVMYQGGTLDVTVTPFVSRPGGAYDVSSAPKYYVEFKAAGHFAWTNVNKLHHAAIDDYATAFFDRYLKAPATPDPATDSTTPDPLAHLLAKPWPDSVSDLRFAPQ